MDEISAVMNVFLGRYLLAFLAVVSSTTVMAKDSVTQKANKLLLEGVTTLDAMFAEDGGYSETENARIELNLAVDLLVFADNIETSFDRSAKVSLPTAVQRGRRIINRYWRATDSAQTIRVDPTTKKTDKIQNKKEFGYNFGVGTSQSKGTVYLEMQRRNERRLNGIQMHSQGRLGYDLQKQLYASQSLVVGSEEADRYSPRVTTELDWSQGGGVVRLNTSMRFFRDNGDGRWEELAWGQLFELAPDPAFESTRVWYQQEQPFTDQGWFTRYGVGISFSNADDFSATPFFSLSVGLKLDSATSTSVWDTVLD